MSEIEKEIQKLKLENEKLKSENEKGFKEIRDILDKLAVSQAKTDIRLGGMGQSIGDSLEQTYFYSLREHLFLDGVEYDSIELNKDILYFKDNEAKSKEFDILLLNGKTIAVIEVKSKPKKSDIIDLANSINIMKDCFSNLKIQEIKLYFGFGCLDKKKENKTELINLAKKHKIKLLISKGDMIEILETKEFVDI